MAEGSIKLWGVYIARINVVYSLFYMVFEIVNFWHRDAGIAMTSIWIILYSVNILLNLFFSVRQREWGKSEIKFWFCFTFLLLVIRLFSTQYHKLIIELMLISVCVNVYILFSLAIMGVVCYQLDNPTADIHSCFCRCKVKSGLQQTENVEDRSYSPDHNSLNNDNAQNIIRSPGIAIISNIDDSPPSYSDVVNTQNAKS